ncbi:MAG: hypothetical protein JWO63_1630 [Frankiales bacterium]|nr:hypothetical protein [Frankiales bacterium]
MIIAAASAPNPPLLLPGMTGAPVAEVEQLRTACLAAIGRLLSAKPDVVVVVGGLRDAESAPPLSLAVARALLAEAGYAAAVREVTVAVTATAAECVSAGREIAADGAAIGLLVMADGSARRTLKAPGYLDERALPFDDNLQALLSNSDWAGVLELDTALAAQLLVAGRAPWQVAAGALAHTDLQATVHYAEGPFGVWYPVVSYAGPHAEKLVDETLTDVLHASEVDVERPTA